MADGVRSAGAERTRSISETLGGIELLSGVDAILNLAIVVRRAHCDGPARRPSLAVAGREVNGVHAAVARAGTLGAQRRGRRADPESIGAGAARSDLAGGLVLRDGVDHDRDR